MSPTPLISGPQQHFLWVLFMTPQLKTVTGVVWGTAKMPLESCKPSKSQHARQINQQETPISMSIQLVILEMPEHTHL